MFKLILSCLLLNCPVVVPQIHPPFLLIAQKKSVLLLYYSNYCPYSQKVLSYLSQIHRTVPMVNVVNNPEAVAALMQVGGKKQVPCLVIDGVALYESDAIIQWLSEHQRELAPN